MPKDNENVPFEIFIPDGPTKAAALPFAPDQMVSCEQCLRANPPTRINCFYCAAALPVNSTTINLQKPALRPLEKWEQGYNNILLTPAANLSESELAEAADILKLATADLERILSSKSPLPLARVASLDEALLVRRRLSVLNLDTQIVADSNLGADEDAPVRIRAAELDDLGITAYERSGSTPKRIVWSDVELLVVGRLVVKRVEVKEQRVSRDQNRVVDSSEFFSDELVIEIYVKGESTPYRIAAHSFDFSCLGKGKSLLAGENVSTLVQVIRGHAQHAGWDESYNSIRKALDAVWPSEEQNDSAGWRRDRPGKLRLGKITEINNERQFMKYSKLRHHLHTQDQPKINDE